MRLYRLTAVVAFFGFLAGANLAFCSTSRTLDLPEITRQADIIADVTVQNTVSYWAAPAGTKSIRTRVNFSVAKLLKGNAGSTLSLEFLGGQVGNRGLKVPGIPEFTIGERYILFSYGPEKAMVSPIVGMDQGALRVIHDNESNLDRVYRRWGQPVSEQENFKTRIPAANGIATRQYLRSAESVEHFAERLQTLINQ
jgi:hypothetical protein